MTTLSEHLMRVTGAAAKANAWAMQNAEDREQLQAEERVEAVDPTYASCLRRSRILYRKSSHENKNKGG